MKYLLSTLLGVLLMAGHLPAQDSIDTEKLDKLMEELAAHNKYMGSVAILKSGEIVYQKSVGFAGNEQKPATANTKYRIGSISKMFTATMIFQLIEEGKLNLKTRLQQFYPQIPNAENISMEMMLRHRSGLTNFTSDKNYQTYHTKPKTHEELVEIFAAEELDFEPDEKASYSNANYVLLGYIIERLDERPYAKSLQERITEPLGLEDTYYGSKIDRSKNEAESFSYHDEEWVLQPETHMSIPGGAGAIVSTAADLVRFAEGLFTGELVSETSIGKMKDINEGFGMGIFQFPFGDRIAFGHNGGIDGFLSHLSYFPKDSVAVASVSNGINYNQNDLLIGLLSVAYDVPYEIPSFVKVEVPEEQLEKYTGTYQSDQLGIDVKIFVEDGNLMAQGTGQPAFTLDPRSETTFSFSRAGIQIEFVENDNGQYKELILNQGGKQHNMQRME